MKVKTKVIRACWVTFEYTYDYNKKESSVFKGNSLIDLDKLKPVMTMTLSDVAAEKILNKWKRSPEIAYNKRLKAWHIFTSNKTVRFGRVIKAQNVQAWFSNNETRIKP